MRRFHVITEVLIIIISRQSIGTNFIRVLQDFNKNYIEAINVCNESLSLMDLNDANRNEMLSTILSHYAESYGRCNKIDKVLNTC